MYNPATGQQPGEVRFASVEECDRAVATAQEAFTTWRFHSPSVREAAKPSAWSSRELDAAGR